MATSMPPATPQRPTPGAFINTPARPGLFSQPTHQAPEPVDTPIQRAARTINSMLDRDNKFPPVEGYIGQGFSGEYELSTNPAWMPFQKLRTYPHPECVFDQVNQMQMNTKMGLLAEINHAYVVIDNQLYLWDYTHPNPELIGFEEQGNNITCVKLVKPRENVFAGQISWLLVVATTKEILLIAVECHTGPEGVHGVSLYQTGMSVLHHGVNVTAIAGSAKSARIFYGGSGSEDIYELVYQQEEKWFSARCKYINHAPSSKFAMVTASLSSFYSSQNLVGIQQMVIDDSRNLLYTLSTNSTIKVYHMRTPAVLENVINRNLGQLRTLSSHIVRQSGVLENLKIVGIDPISANEAEHLSLMATTSTGVRLYMSATSGGWLNESTSAPNSMQIRHIRFPPVLPNAQASPPVSSTQLPPFQGGANIGFDSKYLTHTVAGHRYAPGSFLCIVEANENDPNHELFVSAPHAGHLTNLRESLRYSETGQIVALNGRMQDVGMVTSPFSAGGRPTGFGNELAVQFDRSASEYAILTHFGVETVRRRRLVDIFAALIKYGGGPEGIDGDVRKFAKQYGLVETASTALAVACGQGSDIGPDSRIAKVTDSEVLEFARKVFIEYGGKAQLSETATVEGMSVDNVQASPRHDGIALYVSRLVRSIWDTPIIKESRKPTGLVLEPTHKIAKLQEIQRALIQLQEFLDTNKIFIDGLAGPEALGRVNSRREEVELQGENRALTSLLTMINNIVEGIAFSLVLFEERIEDILLLLPEKSRADIRKLSYHGLFAASVGQNLARELVKAIVQHNINKGSNVETVAEGLRRKCGSFCSSDDVVIFRAQENLKKAADAGMNAEQARIILNDSLQLFSQVARSLSMEHLADAVTKYIELEFYAGAIQLSLKVAQELDRGNKALSWIKDNQPASDAREPFYQKRIQCYELIFLVIEAVDQAFGAQGLVRQSDVISQIGRRKFEAYEEINKSTDEVFQNYLYDWYLSKGWAERLLEINTPYVIDYLRRSSETNEQHADLLWRYYAHYNDYLSAAEVQYQLAKSPFNLSLERRIEYLSRAKANASTRMAGFSETGVRNRQSRQELLRNISDLLDIANIQDDILQKIKSEPRLDANRRADVIKTLDGVIQPLDDLFHSYADQAGYYEICLLIFHAADYRDLPIIRNTWSNLIDQTHEEQIAGKHTAPWEVVAQKIIDIGRRVGLNENVFPVNCILQLLLQHDLEDYTHDFSIRQRPGTNKELIPINNIAWPIDIFITLEAPYETLVATLESIWYAQEVPFNTNYGRKLLAKWMIYIVEQWYESTKRNGVPFNGTENAIGLADCLRVVLSSGELTGTERDWVERGRVIRMRVEEVAR